MRCEVAELVPHFTLHAQRTALYMLFPGLLLSNTISLSRARAGTPLFYNRSSANERLPMLLSSAFP